jgi:hypothetical protein
MLVLPEAATRKHKVSMPKAYKKLSVRAEGSNSKSVTGFQIKEF